MKYTQIIPSFLIAIFCCTYSHSSNDDYKEDIDRIIRLAHEGDATAQTKLSLMFKRGEGVIKSDAEAFKWSELALKNPHASNSDKAYAYLQLSKFYHEGLVVEKDMDKFLEYTLMSANLGNPFGKLQLAVLYKDGNGLPEDKARSFVLFKSIENDPGLPKERRTEIKYAIGIHLLKENNDIYSICEGVRYVQLAAEQGLSEAQYKLAIIFATGVVPKQGG